MVDGEHESVDGTDEATGADVTSAVEFGHVPVMLQRAVDLLGPAIESVAPDGEGAVYVDATLGLGGHSEHFLTIYPKLRLVGLDRDPDALAIARERLARFSDRTDFVHTRYDGIADALESVGLDRHGSVHAALFDLGVSSMQLDEAERGFAYSKDAPLDMRMDPTTGITAADVLNTYSHGDLARILSTYGEERFAGRIASEIVRTRAKAPFRTSGELVELLYRTIPAATRRTGGHPAKRTFQALRVEVNAELDSLRNAIPEDPKFASTVRGSRLGMASNRRRLQAGALFVLGLTLLIAGVALPLKPGGFPIISLLGFLVMFAAGVLLLLGGRRPSTPGATGGSSGSGKTGRSSRGGKKSSGGGFTNRMEERFRRRFEQD